MRRTFLLTSLTWVLAGSAAAQTGGNYPSKPVRIVSPFTAGSTSDIVARLVAERFTKQFGQSFIVENRAGAGGTTGTAYVKDAAPDGYTLLMTTSSTLVISPTFDKTVKYDPLTDFTPVGTISTLSMMLVTRPDFPAANLSEFVKHVRSNRGKFSYASSGVGSYGHLSMELLKQSAGLDMAHIPYKGPSQAETDLLGGQVDAMFHTVTAASPFVRANKLKAFGVSGAEADPIMPSIPTIRAQGVPELTGYNVTGWTGLLAPAGTPAAVVATLNGALRTYLADPEFQRVMVTRGVPPVAPDKVSGMTALMREDLTRWTAVVKATNIKAE